MIPEFVPHADRRVNEALLPPGVHSATEAEVREALVDKFPTSVTRRPVYQGWQAVRAEVHQRFPVEHEYIDGSFVTARMNPDDLDLSVWVDARLMDRLTDKQQHDLMSFRRKAKAQHKCHLFFVPRRDTGDARYAEFEDEARWTSEYWASYRNLRKIVVPGVTKGYIEVVT